MTHFTTRQYELLELAPADSRSSTGECRKFLVYLFLKRYGFSCFSVSYSIKHLYAKIKNNSSNWGCLSLSFEFGFKVVRYNFNMFFAFHLKLLGTKSILYIWLFVHICIGNLKWRITKWFETKNFHGGYSNYPPCQNETPLPKIIRKLL